MQGVPTELNRMLSPASSTSRRSRRSSTRATPTRLRLLPRLCVASEGAVDSIQLVSRTPLEHIRAVAVTPESATSVVLTKVLLPDAEQVPLGEDGRREAPDRRRRAAESAFEDPTPHYDLGRLWLERTGLPMVFAVWACARARPQPGSRSSRTRSSRRCAPRAPSRSSSRTRRASATATRPASSPATSRSSATASGRASAPACYTFLELARDVGELETCPSCASCDAGGRRWRHVTPTPRSSTRRSTASGSPTTTRSTLLRSRDLVAVGRAANEIRNRRTTPTGSRSSSTATSTTRTSASPTATSAPSTAAPATRARATCCRSR